MFKSSLRKCCRSFRFHRSYSSYDRPSFQLTGKNKKSLETGLKYVLAGGIGYAIADTFEHNRRDRGLGKSVLPLDDLDSPQYCEPGKLPGVINQIKAVVGNDPDNFTQSKTELDSHSDTSFNTHHATPEERPAIVIFPKSTEEVSQIVSICHDNKVPVVPFSGGTSLEGHFLPTRRSDTVVLDFSKYMNKVLKLNKTDLDVEVEAGVPWEDLNDMLGEEGLLFGCDPGPGAQIGGCVANSCSGTNAYRYGTMKENVVNLTVVLPDGTVVKTRRRPRKSSAGYNLNGLFTGNEGTLGIVTKATVKCHVKPKFQTVAVVSFDAVENAAACSSSFTQQGIQLDAIELLDDNMMKVINSQAATFRTDWKEQPTLFLKIGGRNERIIQELVHEVENIAKTYGSTGFEFAKDDDEKMLLWEARKFALWSVIDAGKSIKGQGSNVWTTDVALPISNFARVIMETKEEMNSSPLVNATVGHAGDGNFHAFLIYKDDEERKICEKIVANMVRRAIDADGTCTGEHGVGIGKRQYVLEELGQEPVDLMRRIKLAIDPHRIMNPDKIFKIDPHDNNDNHP
ncbi:hypothetical protein ZYGR_0E01210 [Zygosaccharomyces rouxii]|uniref:D-lactate dehydrogenase (cytochrome) n=2 Tax=Zygosaccharomyces rouxii TaxID=4956 RepID=C5DQS7_ZYGRC|nr:uncharacterized protein ZYRO0B02662g [Zygosaccharomyces rouxii]KAH9200312.1 hypothetical protein LQ764DRAFT_114466 [Zygosaccharomyces rouxii]GAV47106.1 hypothetical protein ZYGR_0E01210 [Zygosaccharomyces rouxii]CAR26138.1 ZYRO0B02662p [Zygosaccharomyces rouxii]